jgi:hypothetical protein
MQDSTRSHLARNTRHFICNEIAHKA